MGEAMIDEAREFLLQQIRSDLGYIKKVGTKTQLCIRDYNAADINDGNRETVLVVPTNEKCMNGAGLDMAVNSLGGEEFKKARLALPKKDNDVVLGPAEVVQLRGTGEIKAKHVYFVNPVPFWDEEGEDEWEKQVEYLKESYHNCLTLAGENNVFSITFPILCIGVNGGDAELEHLKRITQIGLNCIVSHFNNLAEKEETTTIDIVNFISYKEKPFESELLVEAVVLEFTAETVLQDKANLAQ